MTAIRFRRCLAIELLPEDQSEGRDLTCGHHLWATSNPVLIGMAADTLTEPLGSSLRGFVVITGTDDKDLTATAQLIIDAFEERRSAEPNA